MPARLSRAIVFACAFGLVAWAAYMIGRHESRLADIEREVDALLERVEALDR